MLKIIWKKKIRYELYTNLPNLIRIVQHTFRVDVTHDDSSNIFEDITIEGYRANGIVGIRHNITNVCPISFYVQNSGIYDYLSYSVLCTMSSGSTTMTAYFDVMYIQE